MVYGRYNLTIVNGDYFTVYKPTYNWGGQSCSLPSNMDPVKLICCFKIPRLNMFERYIF